MSSTSLIEDRLIDKVVCFQDHHDDRDLGQEGWILQSMGNHRC